MADPQIRDTAAPATPKLVVIQRSVTATKKNEIKKNNVYPPERLYIDSSGTYATDGRETLPVDYSVIRSLLRHSSTNGKGIAWQMIAPIKVTICGTDDSPLLVVLNGRQRIKAAFYINSLLRAVRKLYEDNDCDIVKTKNVLTVQAKAGAEGNEAFSDIAWLGPEDIELICGGALGEEITRGYITHNKEGAGPVVYMVRVEFIDVDPNDPQALEISLAERINVATPPVMEAKQIMRLITAGRTIESIAANKGTSEKTIHNKILVLQLVKEVQDGVDSGEISFNVMKDNFFLSTKKNGVIPKPPEEQIRICQTLVTAKAGSGKAGKLAREQLLKANEEKPQSIVREKILTCQACGVELDGSNSSTLPDKRVVHIKCPAQQSAATSPENKKEESVAPDGAVPLVGAPPGTPTTRDTSPTVASGAATTGNPPTATGNAPTVAPTAKAPAPSKAAPQNAELKRISKLLARSMEMLPEATTENGVEAYVETAKKNARVEGAMLALAYVGGDETALSSHPDMKEILVTAMASAMQEEQKPQKVTPLEVKMTASQDAAKRILDVFYDWEDMTDGKPEWPNFTNEDPALQEIASSLKGAFDAAALKDIGMDPMEFAREWVLANVAKK